MIYTDEDILLDGRQLWVHLKPGWSPDTLRTNGYTCHLGVYRRTLVSEIGGFRTEFDGSQDVDMILRLTERTDRIAHIPRTLYHWRAHTGSTAGGDSKPYAYVAARNAIAAHLDRTGLEAEVGYGPPGLTASCIGSTHVRPSIWCWPSPSRSGSERWPPRACRNPTQRGTWSSPLRARRWTASSPCWRAPASPHANHRDPDAAWTRNRVCAGERRRGCHRRTLGAPKRPAVGLTHDWLTRLIGYTSQPDIAAAGPVVVAPDGHVQQAGIAMPGASLSTCSTAREPRWITSSVTGPRSTT